MYHRISVVLFGSICLLQSALGQEGRSLSPDDAVRMALEASEEVRGVRADAAAAAAAYRQARSARFPSIAGLATYTRLSDNIPEISFDTGFMPGSDTTLTLAPVVLNRYHSELSVEQPLFTGGQLTHRIRSARHQADAATYEAVQRETEIAYRAREAYWGLYQAEAGLAATEQALEQVNAHLQDVQNRVDEGAALRSDVLTVQTRLAEVRLERIEAENAVQLARLNLNRMVGLPLDAQVSISGDADTEPLALDLATAVEQALDDRAALDALQSQVEALESQVRATQGLWFPDVALNGRYVYARPNQYFFTEQDEFKPTWEAGLALRWDIWDGGSRRAEVREARARLESAEARLAAAREEVQLEVTRQYLEVQRAEQVVEVARQNVLTAQEAFRMMRQQYAFGAALSADVLDAEQAFRSAQARSARAAAEYAIARAALLRALGEIW